MDESIIFRTSHLYNMQGGGEGGKDFPSKLYLHETSLAHTYVHVTYTYTLTPSRISMSVVASNRLGVAFPTPLGHHRYGSTSAGVIGSPVTVPHVSPAADAWKCWEGRLTQTTERD